MNRNFKLLVAIAGCVAAIAPRAIAFEGKIDIGITQGSETTPLLYTVGANFLRIEVTVINQPNPIDIVDLKSGALTLLFPHNRSFVTLKSAAETSPSPAPGAPTMPTPPGGLPPGIGPQPPSPGGFGAPEPQGAAGTPGIPAMPNMPPMPIPMMNEKMELKPTGKKEKILGFDCEQFEIKQRGETLEIWATDELLPYQPYVRNQPHRFGPRMMEEQWPALLTARKLFPLRASLRFDNGAERFHFEVKSITPEKIADKDGKLFQPPADYFEIQPLPF